MCVGFAIRIPILLSMPASVSLIEADFTLPAGEDDGDWPGQISSICEVHAGRIPTEIDSYTVVLGAVGKKEILFQGGGNTHTVVFIGFAMTRTPRRHLNCCAYRATGLRVYTRAHGL